MIILCNLVEVKLPIKLKRQGIKLETGIIQAQHVLENGLD